METFFCLFLSILTLVSAMVILSLLSHSWSERQLRAIRNDQRARPPAPTINMFTGPEEKNIMMKKAQKLVSSHPGMTWLDCIIIQLSLDFLKYLNIHLQRQAWLAFITIGEIIIIRWVEGTKLYSFTFDNKAADDSHFEQQCLLCFLNTRRCSLKMEGLSWRTALSGPLPTTL